MKQPIRTLVSATVLAVIAASAHAGAFSLYTESSGYTIGNYAAGAAAEAADASTGWYNPAGLALFHERQVVLGGVGIRPRSDISGTSTYLTPIGPVFGTYNQNFSNLQGADSGFVPSFHYAQPFGDRTTLGLSIVAPFGLATDWGTKSPVRYSATFTELLTVDIAPEIGFKVTDDFLVGAGLDVQYARVKFNRMIGSPVIGSLFTNPTNPYVYDSLSYNKGDSWGVGFHAGVMKLFNDNHTRVGLNYQSQVRHKFEGYSQLTGPLADSTGNIFFPPGLNNGASFRNNNLTSNPINLPDIATLSLYHELNDSWALLGSVVYTGWSTFSQIQLNDVAAVAVQPNGNINNALANSTSTLNYRDAWRFAVGANYKMNDRWMMRFGGGYDQTPTVDAFRDVRIPDADRWALSIGAHYQARPNVGIDMGYTHLFAAKGLVINKSDNIGTSKYNINATGSGHADILGAQLVWTIDSPMPMPTK